MRRGAPRWMLGLITGLLACDALAQTIDTRARTTSSVGVRAMPAADPASAAVDRRVNQRVMRRIDTRIHNRIDRAYTTQREAFDRLGSSQRADDQRQHADSTPR